MSTFSHIASNGVKIRGSFTAKTAYKSYCYLASGGLKLSTPKNPQQFGLKFTLSGAQACWCISASWNIKTTINTRSSGGPKLSGSSFVRVTRAIKACGGWLQPPLRATACCAACL
jgi:hypothetical protein